MDENDLHHHHDDNAIDSMNLHDNEELNALTLTTLLNSGVEEALSTLSPAQLIELEKNVQKLKEQKRKSPMSMSSGGISPGRPIAGRKRRTPDSIVHSSGLDAIADGAAVVERPRPTGGQYMNLPASTPQIEYREGSEWLIFTYSTKGHIQEYHIRSDIDDLHLDDIPEDFKNDNCVYPRALGPREAYTGNRWEYETIVNDIAWKLTWRNPQVLCGKRGLIQRAVDSYRNRTPENRSRRVMRQEKVRANSPYAKQREGPVIRVPGPKTLTLQVITVPPMAPRDDDQLGYDSEERLAHGGEMMAKLKIRVDIEGVDLSQVDEEFRLQNAIFPGALTAIPDYGNPQWDYEMQCNELGWKLSWLNTAKLAGKRSLLHKAVEAYQSRVEAAERARRAVLQHHQQVITQAGYDPSFIYAAAASAVGHHLDDPLLSGSGAKNEEEFSQMVAHTLQQALAQGAMSGHGGAEIEDDHQFHDHHIIHHHHDSHENQYHLRHHLHHRNQHDDIEEDDDEHPQTVSTAELLRNL